MGRKKILARFGDVNPVEHGGGVVYKTKEGYFVWEYTPGDQEGPRIDIYSSFIEKDISRLPITDETLNSVNSFSGRNLSRDNSDGDLRMVRIQELTEEDDWLFWADAYWSIFMHSGKEAIMGDSYDAPRSWLNKWWGLYTWKGHYG